MKQFVLLLVVCCYYYSAMCQTHISPARDYKAAIIFDTLYSNKDAYSEFILPKVVLKNKKAANAINEALSLSSLTSYDSIEEILALNQTIEQSQDNRNDTDFLDDGISNISTEVYKNSQGILSIKIYKERIAAVLSATLGGHPVEYIFLTFDLATGKKLTIHDLIKKEKMPELLRLCNKAAKSNYLRGKKEHSDRISYSRECEGCKFAKEELENFYLGKKGLYYEREYTSYGFMRCEAGDAPEPLIVIPKKDLAPLLLPRYAFLGK